MTASAFCIAYRRHLERTSREEIEPPEPGPAQFGMPPIQTQFGRIENPLAEQLRKAVKRDFDEDVMKRVIGRGCL